MAYHPWQEMDFAEILNNNTVKKYIMDDHAAADIVHTWYCRGVESMGVWKIDMVWCPSRMNFLLFFKDLRIRKSVNT